MPNSDSAPTSKHEHPFRLQFAWQEQSFLLAKPFKISRGTKTHAHVVELQISLLDKTAWSEAVPYGRYNESIQSTYAILADIVPSLLSIEAPDAKTLVNKLSAFVQSNLAPCSARNLLDCALWDLKAKLHNKSVNALANLRPAQQVVSAQTLSVDNIDTMLINAATMAHLPLLKVKLDEHDVLAKMQAIHRACPNSQLIIDANEAWSFSLLNRLLPQLEGLNIALIEQPLPAQKDDELIGYDSPIPLCADESCHTQKSIQELSRKYQMVNIKLDKTGGLTEAIALYRAAKEANMQIMLGCMVASSLAMAPIFTLAADADFIDLDGPVLVAKDRPNGFIFTQSTMSIPEHFLWGKL